VPVSDTVQITVINPDEEIVAVEITDSVLLQTITGGAPAADHPSDEIDNRIAGLTANDSTKLVFSTQDHATPEYVRSETCWGADLDLTCVSPWNSGNVELWAGIAITPRHVVFAHHAYPPNASTIRFITADGSVVTRTVSDSVQVGSTDIRIGLLSSDLPASITPAKLLPADWSRWWTAAGTAVAFFDQEEKLLVADIVSLTASTLTIAQSGDATRAAFYETPISGDSGNPIALIVGGETVALACFQTSGGGPSLIGDNLSGVLAAITTLGAHGHAPEYVTFPVAVDAAQVRNPGGLSLPGSVITSGTVPVARLGSGIVGAGELVLHDDGVFRAISGAGTGNVSASLNFGTDNRLIRSDGTGKNVQVSQWSVADAGNMSCDLADGVALSTSSTNGGGAYFAGGGADYYGVYGDAYGTNGAGVIGSGGAAGGIGVLGMVTDDAAYPLAVANVSGFRAAIDFAGTAHRFWRIPNTTATPNVFASEGWVTDQINAVINAAPGALDTLDELAAALGDDANFAATVTTALAGKQATITGAATSIVASNLTASRAVVSDGSGKVAASAVTATELGHLAGVTGALQTQIDGKAASSHSHAATDITSGVLAPDRLASGTALQVVRRNAANTALEFATISVGGGDALTSNPLSQFAATTSAQLRGVLSDEKGTGAALFDGAGGVTFADVTFTDFIRFTGTTHSGIRLNNLTTTERDALSAAAGDFIYNETTTGISWYDGTVWHDIVDLLAGKAAASHTHSGSDLTDGTVTLAKLANMATASVYYRKTAGSGAPEVQTLATLKTDLGLTGTNSGDQTITLTGDVTGSGTGSFTATIASGAVTPAKMSNDAKTLSIGFTADGGGSALSTGKIKGFVVVPFGATITGWSITADAGTATVKVWKIATGTAKPTIANVINTSGVALSSGTHVRSSTVSDFTTTTISAGDIIAFDLTAVATATELTFNLELRKS
jgi:hypothetical protein